MNQRVLFLLLTAIVFSLTGCKKKTGNLIYEKKYFDEIKEARNAMYMSMARNAIPGASIAVAKDGQIIYSEGIGLASKDLEVPVTRNTKFRIGEVSELITSFIYLRMVEEGILHPDSSIQHYLPDFPEKEQKITLHHLVYHASGIRQETDNEKKWKAMNVSIQEGLKNFSNDELEEFPGWFENRSMYNYNLLGAVMEKATDKFFHKILEEYVTDTLQLSNTLPDQPFIAIKGRSDFFDHNFISQVINATSCDLRYCAPSRGILSNAEDLVKFGNAVLYSKLLSEETRNTMFETIPLKGGYPTSMANGWFILRNNKGEPVYGRGGSVTGGNASLILIPEDGLVVAIADNLKSDVQDNTIFDIVKAFVEEDKEEAGDNNTEEKEE